MPIEIVPLELSDKMRIERRPATPEERALLQTARLDVPGEPGGTRAVALQY